MGHSVNNRNASCKAVAICFILAREKCCNNLFPASLLWMSLPLSFINQGLFNYVIKLHWQDDALSTQQNVKRADICLSLCAVLTQPKALMVPLKSRRVSPHQSDLFGKILAGVCLLSLLKLMKIGDCPSTVCAPLSLIHVLRRMTDHVTVFGSVGMQNAHSYCSVSSNIHLSITFPHG